jgi:hypothetical protein
MKNIRQQMDEEKDAPDRKLNIEDTLQLQEKYELMEKECTEKMELMKSVLSEKD